RRNAFDTVPILLNLTSHDEIYPTDDQWRLIYAYAISAAWDGIPLLVYGQEAGVQNDANNYTGRDINPMNNFKRYELNFSKSIPNFKRYNHMTNVWNELDTSWKTAMYETYQRINRARLNSPALRSQNNYMLSGNNGWNTNIFCVAKYQYAGIPAASQDVVIVAINNNFRESSDRWDRLRVDVDVTSGVNWFGIQDTHNYNIVDLMSANPTNYLWSSNRAGSNVKTNFWVGLNGDPFSGAQAQYLKLIDVAAMYPTNSRTYRAWDWDYDDLPNDWEIANGLNPYSATGNDGKYGDLDGDHMANYLEYEASTTASNDMDFLQVQTINMNGAFPEITWPAKQSVNYQVERAEMLAGPGGWEAVGSLRTALSTNEVLTDSTIVAPTNVYYRVTVKP
ncbi:MAG: hypothetical protein V2A34_02380, partial [Lentisphaerota bacterium]